MKKIVFKIILIVSILIIIICLGSQNAFASGSVINPDDFDPSNTVSVGEDALASKAGIVLNVIQIMGIVIAVITLIVIGIKYIVGSVEEKAEYKNTMIPWIIGCILVVSATSVPKLIASFF